VYGDCLPTQAADEDAGNAKFAKYEFGYQGFSVDVLAGSEAANLGQKTFTNDLHYSKKMQLLSVNKKG